MKNICIATLLFTASLTYTSSATYPFQDPYLDWDTRVDDLVGRLTLEELIPQMMALYNGPTPAIPRLGISPYVWISECLRGQVNTNTTAFPQAIGLSASFSNELLYEVAKAISYEARGQWNANRAQGSYKVSYGLSCFSPMINIVRHPLWGRIQECYGEDPYLSGRLAQSYIRGLQGEHERYKRANSGCKAYDAYAGPENVPVSRHTFDAKISMRDLRMTFFPQYKMCVEADTYNFMCSYNSVNGIPSCINEFLLKEVLRNEWGFKGYVVSDDEALLGIVTQHKYLNDTVKAAAEVLKVGVNLELGNIGRTIFDKIPQAIEAGYITDFEVRQMAKPLFYTRMRLGEFDPEHMNPYTTIDASMIQHEDHRELAAVAATKTFVLLKNENNALPILNIARKVAIIGPAGNSSEVTFGNYASVVVPEFTSTPFDGLRMLGNEYAFTDGCNGTGMVCSQYNATQVKMSVQNADLVFVCLGLGTDMETEGRDRYNLSLPGFQLQMLQDVTNWASGAKIVLLLFNAGPIDISWAKTSTSVSAIMECFYPAQSAGDALYRSLTARSSLFNPAGRLPLTWPKSMDQVPPMVNYTMEGRTYRYMYGTPLYPFGYGLSYSRFRYSNLFVTPSVEVGQDVHVSVLVTNIGTYDSDEVVQAYLQWKASGLPAPRLQLVSYHRIHIPRDFTKQVNFTISGEQMALWMDDNIGFEVPPGEMTIYVGGQQPAQETAAPSNVLSQNYFLQPVSKSGKSKSKFKKYETDNDILKYSKKQY